MKQAGLGLIQMLFYIALVALVTGSLLPVSYQIIDYRGRIQNQLELTENKKFLVEKIKWVLASNSAVNSPVKGSSATSLSIDKLSFPSNPLVIDLSQGKARLTSGGGSPTTLTNSQVTVNSLTFDHQDFSGESAIRIQATLQNQVGQVSIDTTIPVK